MPLYILWIVIAYLIGSIPVGIILAKTRGADPRKAGSGNIGATNVMRTAGKTLGILTLAGDILKGLIPTTLALYSKQPAFVVAAIGFATFAGHLFPLFLKFRGGKGVATAAGVYLAISPLAILINVVIFILVLLKWRFVSLGSLVGTGLMPLALLALNKPNEYVYLSWIVGILIFIKHKDNIRRLLDGKENKV
ncbi:MAG: glycerol-3-phosphate 1-O-acyltransferase PlsY [Deltaproteobacteria bacterium]